MKIGFVSPEKYMVDFVGRYLSPPEAPCYVNLRTTVTHKECAAWSARRTWHGFRVTVELNARIFETCLIFGVLLEMMTSVGKGSFGISGGILWRLQLPGALVYRLRSTTRRPDTQDNDEKLYDVIC